MSRGWRTALVGGTTALVLALIGLGVSFAASPGGPAPTTTTSTTASGPTSTTGATTTTAGPASTTTTTAPAATTTTTTAPPSGPAGAAVPTGFQPQSVTFTSTADGWVLGSAPCSSAPCTSVLRTTDGGGRWVGIPGPHVALAASPSQPAGVSELRFADPLDGWAFGPALWATHDGGSRWQPVSLPGAGAGTKVLDLAAAGGRVYALAIDLGPGPGSGRARLYSSPAHGDAWAPVSGVEASTYGGGTIILHGHSAWVLVDPGLSGAHFWRSSGGHALAATPPPCPGVGGRRPFVAAASSSDLVAACGSQAGTGQEAKTVYTSTDGGQTFAAAGDAPREGDLEGVAASPSAIVVAAASGASELYASFDGGRTWQTVVSDTASGGQPWHDLGFTSATQGIVIEGSPPAARPGAGSGAGSAGSRPSRLLETTDGGRTWETVTFSR